MRQLTDDFTYKERVLILKKTNFRGGFIVLIKCDFVLKFPRHIFYQA